MCLGGVRQRDKKEEMEGDIDMDGGWRGKNIFCTRWIDLSADGDF